MKKIIVLSLYVLLLMSCTYLPKEDTIKIDFKNKIDKDSNKNVELIEFEKDNAIKKEFGGMEIYEVYYKGKIKYLKNGFVKKNMFIDSNLLYVYDKNPKKAFCQCDAYKVLKDTEYLVSGKITYFNTENGWQTNNKDITLKIMPNKK